MHDSAAHELNADQAQAHCAAIRDALHAAEHRTILIHGVTGSGKTEVYIQAIEEVVRFGRQAILLVPEISLTPQTVARFRSRFDRVAVLHSHMSDVERHEHWRRIARGEVEVVVGARSAIFAPTPHLGLIVLDEEHESTFKQETAPRYHARDVALRRAADQNVPLVLASATPSLESWHRAQRGEYQLVEMPRRVLDLPLPAVRTIDLRDEVHSKFSRGAISRPLHRAMDEALRDGGQVILLLNRRGHSTHIQCPACGHALALPAVRSGADVSSARQHRPSATTAITTRPRRRLARRATSPGSASAAWARRSWKRKCGRGFPTTPCLRMDTDSMRARGSHEQALAAFRDGRVRILLGTQMIAKGLDFPNVTLVGVVNADTALHLPDFRAAERTFQLVTQVAGRTGRGPQGGRVLVQTLCPDAPAIVAAVRHDLAAFAAQELPHREALGYPPFASMVRIVIRGAARAHGAGACRGDCRAAAIKRGSRDTTSCEFSARRRRRWPSCAATIAIQIQLQSADGELLRQRVRTATADLKAPEGVGWIVDVDPLDMM